MSSERDDSSWRPRSGPPGAGFLDVSRRFLDLLGPEGIGSEHDQRQYAVAGREPHWVLFPESLEQCSAVLRICSELRLSVVPAGFGARLGQCRVPDRLDVVLCLARMGRIVDHAAADLTLVVEAGASLSAVNDVLRSAGQWLPFDPPFPQRTAIGGLVAAQASGPCRQAFGTPRESLIGARAVLADGTVVTSGGRVVKNVAGYDLHRLLAGSFGSLAVLVEANFKCRPLPESRAAVECRGRRAALFELALRVAASALVPSFLEWFGGTGEPDALVVGFAGVPEQVAWALERLRDMAGTSPGIAAAEDVPPEIVASRVEAVARPDSAGSEPFVVRAGLPPRHLATWIDEATRRWNAAGARVVAHAHAGAGVARLRVEGGRPDGVQRDFGLLRRAARERGGYLVAEHQPAGWHLEPWGLSGPSLRLMRAVKRAFDPLELLKGA